MATDDKAIQDKMKKLEESTRKIELDKQDYEELLARKAKEAKERNEKFSAWQKKGERTMEGGRKADIMEYALEKFSRELEETTTTIDNTISMQLKTIKGYALFLEAMHHSLSEPSTDKPWITMGDVFSSAKKMYRGIRNHMGYPPLADTLPELHHLLSFKDGQVTVKRLEDPKLAEIQDPAAKQRMQEELNQTNATLNSLKNDWLEQRDYVNKGNNKYAHKITGVPLDEAEFTKLRNDPKLGYKKFLELYGQDVDLKCVEHDENALKPTI